MVKGIKEVFFLCVHTRQRGNPKEKLQDMDTTTVKGFMKTDC